MCCYQISKSSRLFIPVKCIFKNNMNREYYLLAPFNLHYTHCGCQISIKIKISKCFMVANKIVIRDSVSISTNGLLKYVGDKIKRLISMIKCIATATVHNCEDIIMCL